MFSRGCFEIAVQKTLKSIQKTYEVEFPFNEIARLRSAAYYRTKDYSRVTRNFSGQGRFLKICEYSKGFFFPKSGHFLKNFEKKQGRAPPTPPPLFTCLQTPQQVFLEVPRKERILQSFKNSKKTFPKLSLSL